MNACILDTYSGETAWTEDIDTDEVVDDSWACDCLRAHLHNPRRTEGCAAGGDCLGFNRFLVVDFTGPDTEEEDSPTLHECNTSYEDEFLFTNHIPLD